MVDKSTLSKDIEEQIQSLASDVYIQVEKKLTSLITAAVNKEISKSTDQQSKNLSAQEQSLQQNFSEKLKLQEQELAQIKQVLAEKQADEETTKQNFQVELTQNTINFSETIERLEKEVSNLKQHSTQQHDEKQSNDDRLEEKLLEVEQDLNDKTQKIDGLNGRIMVLTEQDQSLTKKLTQAKEQVNTVVVQQVAALNDAKKQINAAAQKQIDVLAEKLQQAHSEISHVKAQALQSNDKVVEGLQQKNARLTEQVRQEQNGKAELQQQLSVQQKSIDTEQDKNKQAERKTSDYQAQVIKLAEQAVQNSSDHQGQIAKLVEQAVQNSSDHQGQIAKLVEQTEQNSSDHQGKIAKLVEQTEQNSSDHQAQITKLNELTASGRQAQLDEIKQMNAAAVQAKQLQDMAQQKIIELDKANELLSKQVTTEQDDIKLYQQEVVVLNEQVKVAQEGQENILKRFNSNRDKQELENNKVRETIKFLRDENHDLLGANTEQATKFTDELNVAEYKLTEYRLKFEYAQKQLTS
ncbi:hypothetical protein [Colwellia sp. TT2012]|uniref:hypothetical protein n=1 Tax=Colwellia sp. TT2012 TaxID=1720342 RepID=UPI000708A791|nr:hypothetical protein [Colwellia sp. TT2012]